MRAAVLGSPIAHSLSPSLHRAAYRALGLDWTYDAVEVTADQLAGHLDTLGAEWAGLSLTMPLKEAALPLLASRSPIVDVTGAANTLVRRPEGWYGENTDVSGIVAALGSAGVTEVGRAVVLGGGATARSALAALAELGCRTLTLVVRSTPTAALTTADRLGLVPTVVSGADAVLSGSDVLISTLPPGAADPFAVSPLAVPVLLDVAYAPWPSRLAQACRGQVVPGTVMLLHQAAAQVELMTGHDAPLAAMADGMAAALAARSSI